MIPLFSLLICVNAAGVTPVQQVIKMMQGMVATSKQEKHDEQVAFATFSQFCKDTMDQKQDAIADGKARIEQLQADIQKAQADQMKLGNELKVLQSNIAGWEADKADATAERATEKADFDALRKDYEESLDALDRAINVLNSQSADTKQSLMQVQSLARVPAKAKHVIASFLASADPLDVTAPEANAYEFQSGGVVAMLKDLKSKFGKELHNYLKDEMNSRHNFEMLAQELADSIQAASNEEAKKTKQKAQRASDEGAAKGELSSTAADLAEDEKYESDLRAECGSKSKDFEARQTLRKEELDALAEAIKIISSGNVQGNSETYLPQLVQTDSFAFLKSASTSPAQRQCAAFLQGKASQTKSKLLSKVAAKVASDPFGKVKKMIKSLIVQLMEEANSEAEHKGWCDTELSTNAQSRDDKADQVDTLTAQSDELQARIAKLSNEISELGDGIAAIDVAMSQATALRVAEKAKNAQTVADAKTAQVAVAQALQVLRDFYAKSSEATALVQGPAEDAPQTFDKPYKGQGGAAGGVIGMIEVIASDFARLESETSASESEAAEEYQRFSDESAQDKAVKQMDNENKSNDRTSAEGDLVDTKNDLQATQAELDAALAYYDKLKPSCIDMNLSYEERVKQRQEEIESLQEAVKILDGNDIA